MSSDPATDDPKPDHANVCVLWLGRRCGTLHGSAVQPSACRQKWFHAIQKFAASPLQPEFREIIKRDRADNLETLRANLVHCIIRGVPPGIIEINDIDRGNSNRIQWRMIVNQIPVQVAEVFPELQRFGCSKYIARHGGWRICLKCNATRTVTKH